MNVKELKEIIENVEDDVEVVCIPSSHGEQDYNMLMFIEYNQKENELEIHLSD